MSNVKMAYVKHDGDYDPVRMKLMKSPKDSQLLRQNSAVKVRKETDQVKKESESPVKKNLLDKKPLETPVKKGSEFVKPAMVRKDVENVKVVKEPQALNKEKASQVIGKTAMVRKDVENVNAVKKEPQTVNKEKASQVISKIKTVKKQEVAISRSNAASSKIAPKKKSGSKEEAEKKEKKVYDLPGQKHNPPEERDPLRIFYESLYQQNPKSEMAEVWMMEHGLLAFDAAKKAFERKKKSQISQKMGSPVKSVKGAKVEKTSSKNVFIKIEKKRSPTLNGDSKFSKLKRKVDSDDDDDFIMKPQKKLKTMA